MAVPEPSSAVFAAQEGNIVEPLVDGGVAFDRIATAVENAGTSVAVCVAFLEISAVFPNGRGTFFDLLDQAAARGVQVKVLMWAPQGPAAEAEDTLCADEKTAQLLASRDTQWQMRWDSAGQFCQHQKVWLVDAGTPQEAAFVGGINIGQGSMAGPQHLEQSFGQRNEQYGNVHDVHCLLKGPAATDVHSNFVQRWNGASEQNRPFGYWPPAGTVDLPEPTVRSAPAGYTRAQITRSVLPGLYQSLPTGENSMRQQYLEALASAQQYVYLENQILLSQACLTVLHEVLERGVSVFALAPGVPMKELAAAQAHPGIAAGFDALAACGRYPNFCLAAPAALRSWGYEDIYVHSKTAIIDDQWATIGSTNLIFTSFQGDTEMNVSFWDAALVRDYRVQLVDEQTGSSSAELSGREAIENLTLVARANALRKEHGKPLVGYAAALDPATWARN